MSTGRTHATFAWGLSIPLTFTGAYLYASGYPDLGIGVWWGTLAGILITPDADLEGTTWEERRLYNLSLLLGLLWQWAWFLYARAIPHRGISHIPILGTITRIGYLVFVSYMATWIVNGAWLNYCQFAGCAPQQVSIPWNVIQPLTWAGLIIAWVAQDMGHLLLDRKRRRHRKRQPNPWPLILAAIAVGLVVILHQQGLL